MKQTIIIKAALTLSVILLTGCASTTKQDLPSEYHEWAFTQTQTTELGMSLAPILESARVGDQIEMSESEIGTDVRFDIAERYFAASGRPCFKGLIKHSAGERETVICRYAHEDWRITRAVATKFEPENPQPQVLN